jgi:exodeoxyribonuclease VII large subunit
MFRVKAALLDWQPAEGAKVEARALVTLYEPRGRFQLNVETLRRAGLGPLYERFLRLKEKLEREGLFDPAAKRPLPEFPRAIGVVTSLQAAALRDVLTTLRRRNPSIPVIVYPAPVQGEGAAGRLAAMLATANARAECDVLLLVRGGGSIEDLWQFNEETLARAIRASRIPVVVGVGHETDFTIAEFAADRRASTPTAAAELVSPSRDALLARLAELAWRLAREWSRKVETSVQTVDSLARRLIHPRERLRASAQLLQQLVSRLSFSFKKDFQLLQESLEHFRSTLSNLDPAAVLARGYSITRDADGKVVTAAAAVAVGDRLTTRLSKGEIESEVKGRKP